MNTIQNLLVEKYRPQTLDDIILSSENRKTFEEYRTKTEIPNILLIGKPGIGKTSLAKIFVFDVLQCQYLYINASNENGIDAIRYKVSNFSKVRSFDGKIKCIILDEVDGLTMDAQRALRNVMEEYHQTVRFILTANSASRLTPAIKSRCQDFDLTPPYEDCVKRCVDIIKKEKIIVENGNKDGLLKLIKSTYPDLRKIINNIQKFTVNGKLQIPQSIDNLEFALQVIKKIFSKEGIEEIRRFTIENETEFNNDYHDLLKGLFEAVYTMDVDSNKRRDILLVVSDYMYKHQFVLDKEINWFSCMLSIRKLYEKGI